MRTMKDSGVEWIGEIPSDWEVSKLKQCIDIKSGDNISKDEYIINGRYPIIGSNGEIGRTNTKNNEEEVITTGRVGTIGTVQLVHKAWITDNVLIIHHKGISKNYLAYIIQNLDFKFMCSGTAQPLITATKLKNQSICFPPISTQQRIADFLDKKCGKIDEIIEREQVVIEKLKEYKQSVITEAVTKGLNPHAEMKDSGIEWIGKIPKDWEVAPLKSIVSFGKGLPITKENLQESGIPVISYGQIHSKNNKGTFISQDLIRFVDSSYLKSNSQSLTKNGDILFADTSEDYLGIGNCAFVNIDDNLFAGYHTVIVRPNVPSYGNYLAYLFLTNNWRSQLRSRASGIKVFSITQGLLRKVSIILPPFQEQQQIINYLDNKCAKIDKSIEAKQTVIDKLTEYKKSLIYEVVTGKKEI